MRQIPKHPDYYVTKWGDVWSLNRKKFLEHDVNAQGYHKVNLSETYQVHNQRVHKLVAQLYLSNPNKLQDVIHLDGDKSNNHVDNLQWVEDKQRKNLV